MSELPPTHPPTHTHTHTRPPPPPLFVFDPKYVKSRLLPVHVRDLYPGNVIYLETSWLGSLSKVGENKPPEQDLVREPPSPHTPTLFQTISTAPSCTNGPDRQQRFAAQRQWNVFSGGRVSNKRLWSRTTAKSWVTFRLLSHRIWIISLHCKTKYCCPEGSRNFFLNNVEKVKI